MANSVLVLTAPQWAVLVNALVKFIMNNPSSIEHMQTLDLFGDELVLNAEQMDIVVASFEGYQGAAQMMITDAQARKIDLTKMLDLLLAKTSDPLV